MAYNATLIPVDAHAVTPSDSTIVAYFGLYVGSTGNLAVMPKAQGPSGTAVTFIGVPAGFILPLNVCKVMATNTTADDIVGLGPV